MLFTVDISVMMQLTIEDAEVCEKRLGVLVSVIKTENTRINNRLLVSKLYVILSVVTRYLLYLNPLYLRPGLTPLPPTS